MYQPRTVGRLLLTASLAVAALIVGAAPGSAAPQTHAAPVQGQCGNTDAAPRLTASRTTIGADETAVVTVTGSDYLLPPHVCGKDVFGGLYLFFGWVAPGGQWGPSWRSSDSDRGLFGTTFSYPGEGGGAETRDDGTGTVRLIAFTRGGESGTSTDFHMDGAGNWTSNLTIRGATYRFTDLRTGAVKSVDCRVVQCGVFTIGAHAKSSRTNEQFTPINFTDPAGAPTVSSMPSAGGGGGSVGIAPTAGANGGNGAVTSPGAGGPGAGSGAGSTSTTAAPAVGSVGELPGDPSAEVAGAAESAGTSGESNRVVESDQSAAVQQFGAEDAGGGTGGLLAAVVGVLFLGAVAGLITRNKRARGAQEVFS